MRNQLRYLLILGVILISSSFLLSSVGATREGIKPGASDNSSSRHEALSAGSFRSPNLILPHKAEVTADLSVTKVADSEQVTAGANLTYTITVHNPESSAVADVTLTDPLPANTTFVSLTKPASWSCTTPNVGENGTVTCTNASLDANSDSIFTLVVNVSPSQSAETSITNTATVSSTTPDPDEDNNSGTATTTLGRTADLSVTKVADSEQVTAGSNLTYTITVHNPENNTVDNVTLTDVLPANLEFVSLAKPDSWSCTTPNVGENGTVTCTNPSLAANSDSIFTLVVHVSSKTEPGTFFTNTATVSSTDFDPDSENNSGTATSMVPVVSADLGVTKVANSDFVKAGENITYTITVQNAAPYTVDNATLTDTLPGTLTFVSLAKPDSWSCTTPAVGSGGTVTCTNPSLAANSESVFTLIVNIPSDESAGTFFTNTATVSSSMPDPNEENNSASVTTTVSGADIAVTKVGATSLVNVGADITYTITVSNNGPATATNASWSDTLPANTTFVSLSSPSGWVCTQPPVGSGGTVSCTRDSFPTGSAVFTLVVRVDSSVSEGTVISNTATATSETDDPNKLNNSSTETTRIVNLRAWTATGDSSVTEDESNPARPTYTNFTAAVGPNSPVGTYVLRYNIQATDSLSGPGSQTRLRVRFRDEGDGSRVIVTIMQSNIAGGVTRLGAIFNSDNFEPANGFQTQEIVTSPLTFNFTQNTYWLEVTLVKISPTNQPGFGSAQINRQ